VQHGILALAIHRCQSRVEPKARLAQHREFGVLLLNRYRHPAHPVRVPALLQRRVVELARHVEHKPQRLFLSSRRIQTNSFDALHCANHIKADGHTPGTHHVSRAAIRAHRCAAALRTAPTAPRYRRRSAAGVAHLLLATRIGFFEVGERLDGGGLARVSRRDRGVYKPHPWRGRERGRR